MKLEFDRQNKPALRCEYCDKPVTLANGIIAGEEHPGDLYMMNPGVYHKGCLHWHIELRGPIYAYCELSNLIVSLLKGVGVSERAMQEDVEKQQEAWHLRHLAEDKRQ